MDRFGSKGMVALMTMMIVAMGCIIPFALDTDGTPSDVSEKDGDNGRGMYETIGIVLIIIGVVMGVLTFLLDRPLLGVPTAVCVVIGVLFLLHLLRF